MARRDRAVGSAAWAGKRSGARRVSRRLKFEAATREYMRGAVGERSAAAEGSVSAGTGTRAEGLDG